MQASRVLASDRQIYAAIAVVFALSRSFLYALGVRYFVYYGWQHTYDLDLLEHRLWESLLYGHAFPPTMNLFSGVVLKVSEHHAPAIYQSLYMAMGLSLALAMAYLLRALDIGRWLTFALVTLFLCSPPFIYFENVLMYEFPTAVLLTWSAVFFHRALVGGRRVFWYLFFFDCAVIAYTRLTFHLVWVAAMIALALLFAPRQWRSIATAAFVPLLLVVALYAKNQVLFGFFGATSRSGFGLALMTTRNLSSAERREWIRAGKLHAVSRLSPYSGPAKYARYVDLTRPTGIPVLDRLEKADGTPNYNHHALIEVGALLLQDGKTYLAERPWDYLRLVLQGPREYLSPTTRWHPKDPQESPHRFNRAVMGGWEELYNAVLHGVPQRPYGLYVLIVPLVLVSAAIAARRALHKRFRGCEREKLVLFLVLQSAYVPAISVLATRGELARYRFLVEAFMWVAACWAVCVAADAARAALMGPRRRSQPPTPAPTHRAASRGRAARVVARARG